MLVFDQKAKPENAAIEKKNVSNSVIKGYHEVT